MPNKTKFPRSTLKQLLRVNQPRNDKKRISNSADILVYLEYSLFLRELAKEARSVAIKANEKEIQPDHILQVLPNVLQKFKA